jgi:CRISPR-associated protein Cas8a1/Csx13
MAKVASTPPEALRNDLSLDLFGPGMTALHRVGLAGLWMTLKSFERSGQSLSHGSWELTNRSVTLRWRGKPRSFFDGLFQRSFKINKNGLLWFPALGNPIDHPQAGVHLHSAVLGTFLQHGKARTADPASSPTGSLSVEIDEAALPLQYQKVKAYAHQGAARDLVATDGTLRITRLAGWHFPGGVVRHTGFGEDTALEEPPERLLPLLYASVGGIFFRIQRRGRGLRPFFALVLPEIDDLEGYAEVRAAFLPVGVQDLFASGAADAGWRVMAALEAKRLLGHLGSPACRVITFGTVPWSLQQKTRIELFTVRAGDEERLRTFRLCRQVLSPGLVRPATGDPFWDVPQTPDLIARNLTEGRAWYAGFAAFVEREDTPGRGKSARKLWEHVVRYERGGLNTMVTQAPLAEERERTFIRACHEAWRRRMGQLGDRARREEASFTELVRREFERLRVGFARCKNAATLRETVTDFWARAGGPLPDLQTGWQEILPLLDEQNWRKAKDLALLALASYQPASPEEAEALASEGTPSTEGGVRA